MTAATLLLFAGALALNAGTPGPSVAALVAQVLPRGARPVVPFVAAMWIGEAIWLGLAVAGLSVVAERLHFVFLAVKWAGVAYLVHLAIAMWRSAGKTTPIEENPSATGIRLFATGMALTLGNPKIVIFYLALLPSLVDTGSIDTTAWIELTAVQIAVMAACDLTWLGVAARARRFLTSPRAWAATRRAGAVAMAGAAAAIATRG